MRPQAAARSPESLRRLEAPLLYWAEHTDRMPFETGIQRVVRNLRRALVECGVHVIDVGWNEATRQMRHQQPAGTVKASASPTWLLIPEIPLTILGQGLDPVQVGRVYGFRTAAIVHDLIPMKRPSDYTNDEAQLYARYYRMFAKADLIFATTQYVALDLRAYLIDQGLHVPTIEVLPLPAQFAGTTRRRRRVSSRRAGALKFLTVSTWQPRKNLSGLLRAFGHSSTKLGEKRLALTIVGRRNGWPNLDAEILDLAAALPNVQILNRASDKDVIALFRTHHASIYPSYEEGFGLPILESLWLGRPCFCHNGSSMAEVAPGGGTCMIDMTNEATIISALCDAVENQDIVPRLQSEALKRNLRNWADYADQLGSHVQTR